MKRLILKELSKKATKQVFIKGWIHNIRELGSIVFVILKDRSGKIQIVVENEKDVDILSKLQPGTILYVKGKVQKTDKTKEGVEIIEPKIEYINKVKKAWPIEINKPNLRENIDTILDYRALSLRHEKQAAVFKIQGVMAQAYREFMIENGFKEFFGPAMTASSSEGGTEVFKLDYFGKQATLAQSNQLYKQIMVGVFERVFGMAKWFRAENSNTRRHLTEGMQYEFEMGFIDGLEDIFEKLEGVIRYMLEKTEEKCQEELQLLEIKLTQVPEKEKFPVLHFSKAIKIVEKRTGEDTRNWDDLTPEAERELCAYAREKYNSDYIFIKHFPKGVFYAYKDEKGVFHNFDLLCREAEIVSGGRRVDNYDKLVEAIEKEGMDPKDFKEYLSIFKYGMPPHGGFGLGFERFTMLALGLENIRQATIFPSDPKRVAAQHLPDNGIKGAEKIKKEIKKLFVEADLEFQVLKHKPTPTSKDSAKVRGLDINTGVKSLILKEKKSGKNVLVNVPAHKKLDIKAFERFYIENNKNVKKAKFEFEKPERIKKLYGLEVGGVPPFGEVFGVKTYIDPRIFDTEKSAFNNSDQKESLLCKSADLKKVLKGIIINKYSKID